MNTDFVELGASLAAPCSWVPDSRLRGFRDDTENVDYSFLPPLPMPWTYFSIPSR